MSKKGRRAVNQVVLKEDSMVRAFDDGARTEGGSVMILDASGKPLSNRDFEKEDQTNAEKERQFRFAYPVGADIRYYKKADPKGRWYVGYVKNRPLPKDSYPVSDEIAFEMIGGRQLTQQNEAKNNWKRIQKSHIGAVIITMPAKPKDVQFINPDNEAQMKPAMELAEEFKL